MQIGRAQKGKHVFICVRVYVCVRMCMQMNCETDKISIKMLLVPHAYTHTERGTKSSDTQRALVEFGHSEGREVKKRHATDLSIRKLNF